MADHSSHGPVGPSEDELKDSIEAGYEKNDISIQVLLQWGAGLVVFLIATSAASLILFKILQRPPFGPPVLGESFIRRQAPTPPNGTPIVQENPAGDLRPDNSPRRGIDNIRDFRREEEIRMNEYARQDNNIHIPLDRAMELGIKDFAAQKPDEIPTGVPPTPDMLRPQAAPNGANPTSAPPQTRRP